MRRPPATKTRRPLPAPVRLPSDPYASKLASPVALSTPPCLLAAADEQRPSLVSSREALPRRVAAAVKKIGDAKKMPLISRPSRWHHCARRGLRMPRARQRRCQSRSTLAFPLHAAINQNIALAWTQNAVKLLISHSLTNKSVLILYFVVE